MRRKRVHPIRWWILVGVGVAVGLQCLWLVVGPRIQHWQVERAMARFEANPSQARADELVGLICDHGADAEQGRRALRLLLQPQIVVRKMYAVGQPVGIRLERPFDLGFRDVLWLDGTISVDGQTVVRNHGSPRQFDRAPAVLRVPRVYPQTGTYPVEIRLQYAVGIERANRLRNFLAWLVRRAGATMGPGWQPARTYDCDFTVRTEIAIAAKGEAETVQLVSNPELDRAVRTAFLMEGSNLNGVSATSVTHRQIDPAYPYIQYRNLPAAVSFRCVRRLPDGQEVAMPTWNLEQFRAPAGSSGSFDIDMQGSLPRDRAKNLGTIILRPDPELAYLDPTIKAIWNGTLEFPIRAPAASEPNLPK